MADGIFMRKIIKDSIKLYKRGRIVFFLNATIWQWLCHSHTILIVVIHFNPVQDGLFWGCSQMGGGGGFLGPPPKNPPHISYNDETWHSYTLPKKYPKNV